MDEISEEEFDFLDPESVRAAAMIWLRAKMAVLDGGMLGSIDQIPFVVGSAARYYISGVREATSQEVADDRLGLHVQLVVLDEGRELRSGWYRTVLK